jgi:toxin-antitoxin system PIN domain toxin
MQMPDVNILVYAHRREDPNHEFYRSWVEGLANGKEQFALSGLVAVAFVRIVTHPRFSPSPTPLHQALAVLDTLATLKNCQWIYPGENHWNLVKEFSLASSAQGKLVADAQHAAVALEHGCTWVTRDTDFEAFRSAGLRLEILRPD